MMMPKKIFPFDKVCICPSIEVSIPYTLETEYVFNKFGVDHSYYTKKRIYKGI